MTNNLKQQIATQINEGAYQTQGNDRRFITFDLDYLLTSEDDIEALENTPYDIEEIIDEVWNELDDLIIDYAINHNQDSVTFVIEEPNHEPVDTNVYHKPYWD